MTAFTPTPPSDGEKIRIIDGKLRVPDRPIIPFIEGDGTGPDIWRASVRVLDAAVEKAYGGKRQIVWMEVLAGEKAFNTSRQLAARRNRAALPRLPGRDQGAADHAGRRRHPLAQRRPAPDAGSVLLRAAGAVVRGCALAGEAAARRGHGDLPREHRGHLRWHRIRRQGSRRTRVKFRELLQENFPKQFAEGAAFQTLPGFGIKPVSIEGTNAWCARRSSTRSSNDRKSVTLVHKGNIMKFTEGAFRDWGYQLAKDEFGASRTRRRPVVHFQECDNGHDIVIKDVIADAFLQQILTRAKEYDVIATLNLNGDYVSDALAAEVGGIGIAPGGNINYVTGHAVFEATHGTAPKYAGQGQGQPGFADPVGRDDAALPWLERSGRPHHRRRWTRPSPPRP